jgi:hypothetical protein
LSLNYTTYRAQLQDLIASQDPDPSFDTILPGCIDYGEQRIYRELNLLDTVQVDSSTSTAAGVRDAEIANTFVAVNSINIFTPAGSLPNSGMRQQLVPVSPDVLDAMWPGDVIGTPTMFAMLDQFDIILGPCPDGVYSIEVRGTFRPQPLSVSNPNTFLTDHLPDLLIAASMVFLSGYMRNFGAQASDPAMSSSWEVQYQSLFKSAQTEELRKMFWGSSWSSQPVSPAAQPQRG